MSIIYIVLIALRAYGWAIPLFTAIYSLIAVLDGASTVLGLPPLTLSLWALWAFMAWIVLLAIQYIRVS